MTKICLTYEQFFLTYLVIDWCNLVTIAIPIGIGIRLLIVSLSHSLFFLINYLLWKHFYLYLDFCFFSIYNCFFAFCSRRQSPQNMIILPGERDYYRYRLMPVKRCFHFDENAQTRHLFVITWYFCNCRCWWKYLIRVLIKDNHS
jgi:hypothetical protein